MVENIESDIALLTLKKIENMSVKAYNVCNNSGLTTLKALLDFYLNKGTFIELKACGTKIDIELDKLCKKYNNPEIITNILYKSVSFSKALNLLLPYQKTLFIYHFSNLLLKLDIRTLNGLKKISETLDFDMITAAIFSDNFNFLDFPCIGVSSLCRLEKLKSELFSYMDELQKSVTEKTYLASLHPATLSLLTKLPKDLRDHFDDFMDENTKIKLFSLLKSMIDSGEIFSGVRLEIFLHLYTTDFSPAGTLKSLAPKFHITSERIRQIKVIVLKDFIRHFKFISDIVIADLANYEILSSPDFMVFNHSLAAKINENDNVYFNTPFYVKVFGILLKSTHTLIYLKKAFNLENNLRIKRKYHNYYLINNRLYKHFDFISFIKDIYFHKTKTLKAIPPIYFDDYIPRFFIPKKEKPNYNEIRSACLAILQSEFGIDLYTDGILNFRQKPGKNLIQYCYDVINEKDDIMTVSEITQTINRKYYPYKTKELNVRGIMINKKNYFISFSKCNKYGLKKWEKEKENIKGGSLKSMAYEYLLNYDSPKHISEIYNYIKKYRPDATPNNLATNLGIKGEKRIQHFPNNYFGIKGKKYPKMYSENSRKNLWADRVEQLKLFREQNQVRWPYHSSHDENERNLYKFVINLRVMHNHGKLSNELETQLHSMDFPFKHPATSPRKKTRNPIS